MATISGNDVSGTLVVAVEGGFLSDWVAVVKTCSKIGRRWHERNAATAETAWGFSARIQVRNNVRGLERGVNNQK